MNYHDLIGQRFGLLLVVGIEREAGKNVMPLMACQCDCGKKSTPQPYTLLRGTTKSCGCLQIAKATKHGQAYGKNGSKTYMAWSQMKARCDNERNKSYADYGGRGISYCESWKNFANFLADMGEAPIDLSLDRIDNSLGYSKENCRWATSKQQSNNRRNTRMIEYQGKKWPKQELAEEFGISASTLMSRLRSGWPIEKALIHPVNLLKASKRIKGVIS